MSTAYVILVAVLALVLLGTALLVGIRLGHRRAAGGNGADASAHEPRPVGVLRRRRSRPPRSHFQSTPTADQPRQRLAVVVNPTKVADMVSVRARITAEAVRCGWEEPMWLLTTPGDYGRGQARQALEAGVDLVCVVGGDGTVRRVASVLEGTPTPLGLLPAGTGNLLARNLGLPLDDRDAALGVALTGSNKRVDVGRLFVDASGEHERPEEYVFLVMAGLGWDAAMISGTPDRLKKRVGYLAYGFSGIRSLPGSRFKARIIADDAEPLVRRARTVVIGNCGKLVGGILLMPKAEVDDGLLDAVVLSPRGLGGWIAVAGSLLRIGRRSRKIDEVRGKEIVVRSDRPEQVQIDGDVIGAARAITARVEPLSLVVRVG